MTRRIGVDIGTAVSHIDLTNERHVLLVPGKRSMPLISARIVLVICLVVFSLGILGCGTSHQFMPPRPMERGQWEIQTYWHLDMTPGRLPVVSAFPAVNFYTGLGQNINLGFSAGPLLVLPANVSVSRSYQSGDDRFWTHYLSYTPPLSGTLNPVWETGVAYSIIDDDIAHSFTLALGLGQYTAWENQSLEMSGWGKRTNPLIPIAKYTFTGKNGALEWSNHFGNARNWMRLFIDDVLRHNDTVIVYPSGTVVSVTPLHGHYFHVVSNGLEIVRSDGVVDSIDQVNRFVGDVLPVIPFGINDLLRAWIGSSYVEYSYKGVSFILDPKELQRKATVGGEIIIRRFPDELVARVKGLSPFIHDNSIGAAILSHTEKSAEE